VIVQERVGLARVDEGSVCIPERRLDARLLDPDRRRR
jgi:hypothetical protein